MAATIKIKNSSTASAVPTSSDLVQGELAVNVTDKRIFTENSGGTVVELGTNPSILTLPDGSASAPTLTNDGDTNTGIFFPAADTVGITTGGTERARVDSSGNLLIGATSGSYPLLVKKAASSSDNSTVSIVSGTAGYAQLLLGDTASDAVGYVAYNNSSNSLEIATNGSERMRVDSSGNLGVGTSSPSAKLHVNNGFLQVDISGTQAIRVGSSDSIVGGTDNNGIIQVNSSKALLVYSGGSERARIDSSGQLLIGTTDVTTVAAGAFTFRSVGTTNTYLSVGHKTGSITGADFVAFYYNTSQIGGCAQNGTTAVSFNTTSDYRLKTNISPLTGALAKVEALKPSSFEWIDGRQDEGFIAHELQAVLPNVVSGAKDAVQEDGSPKYQQVDYSKIVTVLTAAIQEQQAIIQQLQADVAALKG